MGASRLRQSITKHLIGSPRDETGGYPDRLTDGEEGPDRSGGGDEGEDEHDECSDEEQTTHRVPLFDAPGHASSSFTMDRYGHLFEAADSQAASAVAAMVDGATPG